MPNPTRETTAGRAYNDLRNLARRTGRGTDELLTTYVLERFLFRLSLEDPPRFVLKGGLLLACFGARRPTRDIDLLSQGLANDQDLIRDDMAAIAATYSDDGVVFEPDTIRTSTIREDANYFGVRVIMPATLVKARLRLGVDVNFGDPVTPAPQPIEYPQILGGKPFELLGYPIETVIAEKLCTAAVLADLNTRERDYADLYQLLSGHDIEGRLMRTALANTARYRGAQLLPLSQVIGTLPERRRAAFAAWRLKQGPDSGRYPLVFREVVEAVIGFADPVIDGSVDGMRWVAQARRWIPNE